MLNDMTDKVVVELPELLLKAGFNEGSERAWILFQAKKLSKELKQRREKP